MLLDLSAGDKTVFDRIVSVLYKELLILASGIMRNERNGHLLETGALVDEAYMKLVPADYGRWKTRGHFLKAVAVAMRRILVDYARNRDAEKRGGGIAVRSLDGVDSGNWIRLKKGRPPTDFELVNWALENYEASGFRRGYTVIQLHYFLQMNQKEIAEGLGLATKTVKRDLQFSLAWLNREMKRIAGNECR